MLAHRLFTVQVTIDHPAAYEWIAEWLAAELLSRDSTVLTVAERELRQHQNPLESRAVFLPGEGLHVFWRDGRRIVVEHIKGGFSRNGGDQAPIAVGGMTGQMHWQPSSFVLRTFGRSSSPLRRLVVEAEVQYREARHTALPIWTARWGHWDETRYTRGRPLESVVLAGDTADALLTDVRRFLGSEERYADIGIPWRRGYLLYGPPGCGKSSLAKAIATECRLPLYVLSLTKTDDDGLHGLLAGVRPRSIVLLEDVEEAINGDPGEREGVTRSGLLNALDGVAATEGRILIMTTNHRDRLDPAVVRPGRADVQLELLPATSDQAARMYRRFFPEDANGAAGHFARDNDGETPATIQGRLIEMWEGRPSSQS
jgi:chaperone BCS1